MFAPPEAEGHLELTVDQNDLVMDAPEFIVAITSSAFDQAEIDIPICVALVT